MTITASFIEDPDVTVTIEPDSDAVDPETGGIVVGQNTPFLVTVSNLGGDATDVRAIVPLPANTEFVSAELIELPTAAQIPGTVTCDGDNIIIRTPLLAGGALFGVRLVLKATQSGEIVFTPQVETAEGVQQASSQPSQVGADDETYEIVRNFEPLGHCGEMGLLPLGVVCAGLALMKRQALP